MESEELLTLSEGLAQHQEQLLEGKVGSVLRLQPGEDLESLNHNDAVHWTTVYSELLGFKRELIAHLEESLDQPSEEGVHVELERDHAILTLELQRLQLHYAFWSERLESTR